jgi:hypothetical protein
MLLIKAGIVEFMSNWINIMNWYKKAQAKEFPSWLAKELQRLTENYTKPLPPIIQADYNKFLEPIEDWVKEYNPDLSSLTLMEAYNNAITWRDIKHHRTEEDIRRHNWNKAIAESQNINPDSSDFMVDLRLKRKSIPANIKSKINKEIHALGNYHLEIPLQQIMDICEKYGVVLLQEDGTKWGGFLLGAKECGSEEARNQRANFELGVRKEDGQYIPANNAINLTWCTMQSGKYEIVCYLS